MGDTPPTLGIGASTSTMAAQGVRWNNRPGGARLLPAGNRSPLWTCYEPDTAGAPPQLTGVATGTEQSS